MHVVVKLGGCNGSGKTTLGRTMLALQRTSVPIRRGNKTIAYHSDNLDPSLIVLGRYETACGGMDAIQGADFRTGLVKQYARQGSILFFEGLITGKCYGAIGAVSDTPSQRGKWIYAFMDTPYEVCVERVLARRKAKGNNKPFDAERTMRQTYRIMTLLQARVEAMPQHRVHIVDHTDTPEAAARKLLDKARRLYRAGH